MICSQPMLTRGDIFHWFVPKRAGFPWAKAHQGPPNNPATHTVDRAKGKEQGIIMKPFLPCKTNESRTTNAEILTASPSQEGREKSMLVWCWTIWGTHIHKVIVPSAVLHRCAPTEFWEAGVKSLHWTVTSYNSLKITTASTTKTTFVHIALKALVISVYTI